MSVKKKAQEMSGPEAEKFQANSASDMIRTELDIVLDDLEEQELEYKLTSGDKQVMSILQQSIAALTSSTSLKELFNVLNSSVDALRGVNSNFAPKLAGNLLRLKGSMESLFSGKDIVLSQVKVAVKQIFAQENMEEAHPDLDKYQSVPLSDPSGTEGTPVPSDIEESGMMGPEESPKEPRNATPLIDRVNQALDLLNEAKDLFRADDFFVKKPRRKDRILSSLIKNILRAKKSGEMILKLMNRKPTQKP